MKDQGSCHRDGMKVQASLFKELAEVSPKVQQQGTPGKFPAEKTQRNKDLYDIWHIQLIHDLVLLKFLLSGQQWAF